MTPDIDHEDFDKLPRFDARAFDPPAWANEPKFRWDTDEPKLGESSRSAATPRAEVSSEAVLDEPEEEDEAWEDAKEDLGVDPETGDFTNDELRKLLTRAIELKAQGNSHFTSKPPSHASAVEAYKSALAVLPPCPRKEATPQIKPKHVGSVIEEVTDEQAEEIIAAEQEKEHPNAEQQERDRLEEDIRDCTKACWSNLAACHLAMGDNKDAVEACTEALKVDPHHVKALQRRATANERLSTWSSLTSAKEGKCCVMCFADGADYEFLLKLLPASLQAAGIRRSLAELAPRIQAQQDKEKDEMMAKLKELGNGLLGKFGLSTDMFKFDAQPGGGYNMRFER